MSRSDMHLDAMLRHLGAAYYDSLQGRATRTDVTRAVEAVRQGLGERSGQQSGGTAARVGARPMPPVGHGHPVRWTRRVRDVMTASVVTVDRITPYKDIARLMAEHRISGLPVLTMGRHVAGVVTEADLLRMADRDARRARMSASVGKRTLWWRRGTRRRGLTAVDLMTSPAVTIHPDSTIPAAARVMNTHRVRRLPVVDSDNKLVGMVSRRDLLATFLRPDAEIAAEVRELLDDLLHGDAARVTTLVRGGVVVLAGDAEPANGEDLIPVALRLIWDVDGVVDVVNRITAPEPAETG